MSSGDAVSCSWLNTSPVRHQQPGMGAVTLKMGSGWSTPCPKELNPLKTKQNNSWWHPNPSVWKVPLSAKLESLDGSLIKTEGKSHTPLLMINQIDLKLLKGLCDVWIIFPLDCGIAGASFCICEMDDHNGLTFPKHESLHV